MPGTRKVNEEAQKLKDMQVSIPSNQIIFNEGDTSREMYILMQGEVEILKNNKRIAIVEGEAIWASFRPFSAFRERLR